MKARLFYLFLFILVVALAAVMSSCKKEETPVNTIERGTVTDREGNVYQTVKIGEQWWMAENLRSSTFSDGSAIDYITIDGEDSLWTNTVNPTYTFINAPLYGFLYNWIVVSGEKAIAPEGWHIPTDDDWKTLESTIGLLDAELNMTGWRGVNEAELLTSKYSVGWPEGGTLFGSDEYGFNALPGGCRIFDGRTNIFNNTAFWWTSTSDNAEAWYRYIDLADKRIFRQHTYPQYGMSIRCVKN